MKANSTQRAVRLQSKRDSVHIVFADSKPDFDEEAFHTLSAADDDMVIEVIDTDVWALAITDRSSLVITETPPAPAVNTLKWLSPYEAGQIVDAFTQVFDDGYLMVSNKETSDPAAPDKIGSPTFDQPDPQIFVINANNSVVYSGSLYDFTETGTAEQIDVLTPTLTSSTNHRILIIENPGSGNEKVAVIEEPVLIEGQWSTIAVGNRPVVIGTRWLVILDALNSGSSTPVTGGWRFDGVDNNNAPATQGWNRNNLGNVVRIDKIDLDSTNRETELLGVIPGSIIRISETAQPANYEEYIVTSAATDSGTDVTWQTEISDAGGPGLTNGMTTTINIDIPIPQSTDYTQTDDWWLTNQPSWANISGYLAFDGVEQSVPNHAFGVRLKFQRLILSDDWDFAAFTDGISTSTGGAGTNSGVGLTSSQFGRAIVESLEESFTSFDFDANPVTKLSQTIQWNGGRLMVGVECDAKCNKTNRAVTGGLYIDDGTTESLVFNEFQEEPKDVNDKMWQGKRVGFDLPKGVYTFRFKFGRRGGGGNGVVTVDNLQMIFEVF